MSLSSFWDSLSPRAQVVIAMNINILFLTTCMVLVKKTTAVGVKPLDLTMFRSFTNCLLSSPLIFKFKKHPIRDIPPGLRCTMLCRCLVGTVAFFMLVIESDWLPIFVASTMNNTIPFFTAIFGYFINSE